MIDIRQPGTGCGETIGDGLAGKPGPMFDALETFLLRCGNQPSVTHDRRRRVGMKCIETQDQQSTPLPTAVSKTELVHRSTVTAAHIQHSAAAGGRITGNQSSSNSCWYCRCRLR